MSVQTFSAPISASMLCAASKILMHTGNYGNGFTALVHPDIQADIEGLAFRPQDEIRKKLLANNRKSSKGRKHRGLKWVQSLRAQCAIHGHVAGWNNKCRYCGLRSD